MRGIELSLNQTQKLRLQRVLELLESMSSGTNYDSSVTVADSIHVKQEDGVLKGHGMTELEGEVVTTVCGVIERVNKLVYWNLNWCRYKPEVGDIIVAHLNTPAYMQFFSSEKIKFVAVALKCLIQVRNVAPKRWRLEINFSQDAVLMLSLMNLPDRYISPSMSYGHVNMRWTAVDELNMCTIFEENDVICAEVRDFMCDGNLQLQARSQKYGKGSDADSISIFSKEAKTTFPSSTTVWIRPHTWL
uniref:RRP4 S1 domain-containing protein n=1 Tax=Lactuca sativa TaxID=4236 RepID=A0A9R1WHB7_LACSA|nr:hypothetical protein LSAT_V11C200050650 [Lactuca sativa]